MAAGPKKRRTTRRPPQFNVPIDAATGGEVKVLCTLLMCSREELFREALDALLGRRPPLSAADRELFDRIQRRWRDRAARPPRGTTD